MLNDWMDNHDHNEGLPDAAPFTPEQREAAINDFLGAYGPEEDESHTEFFDGFGESCTKQSALFKAKNVVLEKMKEDYDAKRASELVYGYDGNVIVCECEQGAALPQTL